MAAFGVCSPANQPEPKRTVRLTAAALEPPQTQEPVREVPWMVAPLAISAAASLFLGLYPTPVLELAGRVLP